MTLLNVQWISAFPYFEDFLTGTTYDAGGNLTSMTLGGETFDYEYDGLSMMRSLVSNTDQAKVFLYSCFLSWADDERFAVFECVSGFGPSTCASGDQRTLWYMRDLDGKVLRSWELQVEGQHWTWLEDNIFRAGQPLATVTNDGNGNSTIHHLHLDHLGTPRQITDSTGTQSALHHYYPFGQEATDPAQDPVRLKYTGHERDKNGGSKGMLDYMHARYESAMVGRFFSVDPVLAPEIRTPQGWNRYAYVAGNPLSFVDPTGLVTTCVNGDDGKIICTEDEPVDVVGNDPDRDGSFDPNTGLAGLNELTRGRRQMNAPAMGQPNIKLSLGERILSAIPINGGVEFGRCVRENRFEFPEIALGSAFPKRLLPPFRVPRASDPLTTIPSAIGLQLRRLSSPVLARTGRALRTAGRRISPVATPLTIAEGLFDLGVIFNCSIQ